MAPPTPEQINDYINGLIPPLEGHVAYEWSYLVSRVWRHFASSSNAVDKRMTTLTKDGRLVAIRVDYNGLVFLPHEDLRSGIALPHFTFHEPYRYSRQEYGTVSFVRNKENLWTNGVRLLYMLPDAYEAMLKDLSAQVQDKLTAMRRRHEAEQTRLVTALQGMGPDALDLLERLREQGPDKRRDIRVEPHLSTVGSRTMDGPEKVRLTIDVDESGMTALLEILRRGLPAVQN